MHIPDNHIFLTSAAEVNEICKPLFDFYNITHFGYIRVYKDGSQACLNTHPTLLKHVLDADFADSTNYNPELTQPASSVILWKDGGTFLPKKSRLLIEKKIFDSKEYFNVNDGIAIVEGHKDYYDAFNFATNKENSSIVDFYFNNFDILKLFILYFKDKAQKLMNKAHANKIVLPWLHNNDVKKNFHQDEIKKRNQKEEFLKRITPKRFFLGGRYSHIFLTLKQLQCLILLATNHTAKQAAKRLNVSPRTIEYHINIMKAKLECDNLNNLIQIFWNSPLASIGNEILNSPFL